MSFTLKEIMEQCQMTEDAVFLDSYFIKPSRFFTVRFSFL